MKTKLIFIVLTVIVFSLQSVSVPAQINLKKITKNAVNNRATKDANQAVGKGLDEVEGIFKNKDASKKEPDKLGEDKAKTEPGKSDNNSGAKDQLTLQAYSKYDFIPGERVIFFEDFSQTAVGDFPALWNTNGSGEVVTTNLFPGNWLKFLTRDAIWTDELLKLPENYTIEFDVVPIKGGEGRMAGYSFRMIQSINSRAFDHGSSPGKAGFNFDCEYFGRPNYRTYINGDEGQGLGLTGFKEGKETYQKENQKYHIAIWAQKSRIRVYQNETKLFDLPKAFPLTSVKMDRIRFEDGAAMVSNIRVAVGAPDMRSKLITEGKLVSYGIYFDVNKDVVKPESYDTLKGIADVLKENPDVKVKIVGHTDSDGPDAANLDLSKRRGASVKDELVKSFSIDASRIEADGLGESQPVAPNDIPSNKALNRRVEFIKL